MKKFLLICSLLAYCGLHGSELPVTKYTVIAEVVSYENYVAWRQMTRFSFETPYGNQATIVAKILAPASLAGREIAIPFESTDEDRELLVRSGTVFRWEHYQNLVALRNHTSCLGRAAIEFPRRGIIVLKASGEVAATYPGSWTKKS